MMREIDYIHPLTKEIQAQISISAVLGAMVGQLFFGVMGDRVSDDDDDHETHHLPSRC